MIPDEGLPVTALRVREVSEPGAGDQLDAATAEAFARRLTPLHTADRRPVRGLAGRHPSRPQRPARPLSDVRSLRLSLGMAAAAGPGTGSGCR